MEYDRLKIRTRSLREDFSKLEDSLRAALRALDRGEPPKQKLAYKIVRVRQEFDDLRREAIRIADSARRWETLIRTLSDLEDALESVEPPCAELHRQAQDLLGHVARIVDRSHEAGPVKDARAAAQQLQEEIDNHEDATPHPQAEAIVERTHPLGALWALVSEEGTLSDAEWDRSYQAVHEFSSHLATAAARGRLSFGSQTEKSPEQTARDMSSGASAAPNDDAFGRGEEEKDADAHAPEEADTEPEAKGAPTECDALGQAPTALPEEQEPAPSHPPEDSAEGSREGNLQEADPPPESEAEDAPQDEPKKSRPGGGAKGRGSESRVAKEKNRSGETAKSKATTHASPQEELDPLPTDLDVTEDGATEQAAQALRCDLTRTDAQMTVLGALLHGGLDGLAYHVASALETAGYNSPIPSWLIRAFLLGPRLRSQDSEVAPQLQFTEEVEAPISRDGEVGYVNWLMAFGATLRPAFHAPRMTSAIDVLEKLSVRNGLEPLAAYAEIVRSYAHQRGPVEASVFDRSDDESIEDRRKRFQEEAREWRERAGKRTTSFVPATQTWHVQLEKGDIGAAYRAITDDAKPINERIEAVEERIERIREPDYQQLFHESTDKNSTERIEGAALGWLKDQFKEFQTLAVRWLDLARRQRSSETNTSEAQTTELIRDLQHHHEAVHSALNSFADEHHGSLLGVTASRVLQYVTLLHQQLSGEVALTEDEPSADALLHADLLRVPTVERLEEEDSELAVSEGDGKEPIRVLLQTLGMDTWGWGQAFETYLSQERFDRSQQLIERVRTADSWSSHATANVDPDALEEQHEEALQRSRWQIKQRAQEVHNKIESAFQFGYLDYNGRATLLEKKEQAAAAAATRLDLCELRSVLDDIERRIHDRKQKAVDQVRERLQSSEVQSALNGEDYNRERIERVLNEGDVYTANAYIDRVLSGDPIPKEEGQKTAFDPFFPDTLRKIGKAYSGGEALHQLSNTLEQGDDLGTGGALSFGALKPEARKQAADYLRIWIKVRREERIGEDDLADLLSSVGFLPKEVEINSLTGSARSAYGHQWAEVEVADTSIKRNSPVPAYGSETGGRYRFLISYGSPTAEEMGDSIEEIDVDEPASVVLHFGFLGDVERQEIAAFCREHESNFIVLDEGLYLYLLSHPRGDRLRILFECALPFTYVQPYSEVGSRVPPEMFFGREREIEEIKAPNGPSLVYGGRQLGKTVLLRQAKREFHSPPDRIACWIDLRSHGINEEARKIWALIVEELRPYGVFGEGDVHQSTGPDTIRRYIREWIEDHPQRRVLLLLDEADEFFTHEQETDFAQTVRLKGLMEETNGRFKVVFAGLHNVLRTVDAPNQPLAHLRGAICVGPLLKNGEWQAARSLVKRPLEALGYRFESEDLVTFILNLTNYYPSLIQLYCRYLLEEVVGTSSGRLGKEKPPYAISKNEVRESRGQSDLMRQIREKFLWTLQLDPRYELLAYAIGYAIKTKRASGSATNANGVDAPYGFAVDWVQKEAREWWSEGFRGSSSAEHIQALLDEMVGLGVLRETSPHRYTLRSPNVLPLLGSIEEMERNLTKERIVKPEFDPKTHRRHYAEGKLAPITSHQHGLLTQKSHGVAVVYGTVASGIDEVPAFMGEKYTSSVFHHLSASASLDAFDDWIGAIKSDRQDGAVTVALIDHQVEWTEAWIEQALEQVQRLRSKHAFFRVIFLADPARTWDLCVGGWTAADGDMQVTKIQLQPWHDAALHSWFLEQEQNLKPSQMQEVGRITGNWPLLLESLRAAMRRDPSQWSVHLDDMSKQLDQPEAAKALLGKFGIASGPRRRALQVLAALDEDRPPPEAGYRLSSIADQADPSSGVRTEEVAEYAQVYDDQMVAKSDTVLAWAQRLELASLVGTDRWQIDPLLGRLLRTIEM